MELSRNSYLRWQDKGGLEWMRHWIMQNFGVGFHVMHSYNFVQENKQKWTRKAEAYWWMGLAFILKCTISRNVQEFFAHACHVGNQKERWMQGWGFNDWMNRIIVEESALVHEFETCWWFKSLGAEDQMTTSVSLNIPHRNPIQINMDIWIMFLTPKS